ncbi:MAG TPA: DUF721 domain-containing protein [Terriglobia bacterium]|nr:DUF721 domain-containing protein [Terriglobia bacterium]
MRDVGTVLPKVLSAYLAGGEPRVVEILAPLWARVTGQAIAAHSRPVGFAAGTLIVATSARLWAVQLERMAEEIRAAVNRYFGRRVVAKLRIDLRTAAYLRRELGEPEH